MNRTLPLKLAEFGREKRNGCALQYHMSLAHVLQIDVVKSRIQVPDSEKKGRQTVTINLQVTFMHLHQYPSNPSQYTLPLMADT